MSCFVMDKFEIWYLVEAAYRYLEFHVLPEKHDLARQLLQDNLQAVKRFYGDSDLPGPVPLPLDIEDEELPPFWEKQAFDPVQVIKAAKCYLYQTGSLPEKNASRQLMRQLIDAAIMELPGYEDAKWGAPAPKGE